MVFVIRYLYKPLYLIHPNILEKTRRDLYGSIILAGTSALNSGITLADFSLSRKISFFKDISNKYLSGMSNLLNQFLTKLKPISSYLKLLFVFSEKNASLLSLIVRGSIGMVVSTF